MKKKIFAVSDAHGHAAYLKKALDEAGFVVGNGEHLLVSCGDNFDRGTENREMYDLLCAIPNKVLVKGNHEDNLERVLKRGSLIAHDYANGTDKTIAQFFDGSEDAATVKKRLRAFTRAQIDWYETKNHVFVHGWLPIVTTETGRPALDENWRNAGEKAWKEARELQWQQAYAMRLTLPDKTIVCGHRAASLAHVFDLDRYADDYTAFYGDGVVAIDACTTRSGFVNVYVTTDDVPEE